MSLEAQSLVVHLTVLLAAGWLARMAWQTMISRKPGSCGGCASKGCETKPAEPQVFTLTRPKG
jgi:hypothetical protein